MAGPRCASRLGQITSARHTRACMMSQAMPFLLEEGHQSWISVNNAGARTDMMVSTGFSPRHSGEQRRCRWIRIQATMVADAVASVHRFEASLTPASADQCRAEPALFPIQ